ncbi:phytanoyl-CoA dioxygenase family protein [Horticoccus luteus]|uniref:Phytanoyl-CoA dioxygenase family protein n=1 Tax=Horticoccus luteus TaxID=2862869 RepID=A0A8F9XKQ2_9BACT|nr:phytanoyl-CoA dioxygenase family protein [Horticoccus luteus]QYM78431.1 phytanoyl-CoA dioxygenase family protein [Horticoccus luteus]
MSTTQTPSRQLTDRQREAYLRDGYLLGLPPIYTAEEMAGLNAELPHLLALLRPGETTNDMREWHHESAFLYEIVMNPRILDLVEGILGPNFYVWGSHFFIKPAHSAGTVPWHQDAYYWPLSPCNTVTAWLAFDDVDEVNGGMKLIPGSHRGGIIKHRQRDDDKAVIKLELEEGTFNVDDAVQFRLKAGEISLHDDRAIHGSQANPSDRRRAGLTIRYSGTNVKADVGKSPEFTAHLCRGVDTYGHTYYGPVPTQRYGRKERTPPEPAARN